MTEKNKKVLEKVWYYAFPIRIPAEVVLGILQGYVGAMFVMLGIDNFGKNKRQELWMVITNSRPPEPVLHIVLGRAFGSLIGLLIAGTIKLADLPLKIVLPEVHAKLHN